MSAPKRARLGDVLLPGAFFLDKKERRVPGCPHAQLAPGQVGMLLHPKYRRLLLVPSSILDHDRAIRRPALKPILATWLPPPICAIIASYDVTPTSSVEAPQLSHFGAPPQPPCVVIHWCGGGGRRVISYDRVDHLVTGFGIGLKYVATQFQKHVVCRGLHAMTHKDPTTVTIQPPERRYGMTTAASMFCALLVNLVPEVVIAVVAPSAHSASAAHREIGAMAFRTVPMHLERGVLLIGDTYRQRHEIDRLRPLLHPRCDLFISVSLNPSC